MVRDRVINVCFHGIGEPARALEPGEDPYWITAERYGEILDELVTWPSVSISFDDGNASDAEIGLAGLLERGLEATFFVLAGRIDQPGSLSTAQLEALRRNGMRIGTHGMRHIPWTGLDATERRIELVDARRAIEEASGSKVDLAACPLGRYDRTVLHELRALGYRQVHTSDRTTARPDEWLQPRYSIRRDDTAATVRRSILGRQSALFRVKPVMTGFLKRHR